MVTLNFVQAGKFEVRNERTALFGDPQGVRFLLSYKWVRWACFSSFPSAMPEQLHRRLIYTRFSHLLIALWLSATCMVMFTLSAAASRFS